MPADIISFVDDEGHERFMGNIEPPAGLTKAWKVFGDTQDTPMILESKWADYCVEPFESNPLLPPVADQDGIGMCNASATCSAMEYTRRRQGLPHVELSGGDLYMRICGGRDQGSMLEDGLAESFNGVASTKTVPYLDWRGENPGAANERKSYCVQEAFHCPEFGHCFSAVIAGYALIDGGMWYPNYKIDENGWLPRGSGRPGGHAVFGFAPITRGGKFGIEHQNSWTASGWGRKGRGVFPRSFYSRDIGGFWAVRSVTDEGGVIPSPK